jgi:hypothetical protein
MSEVTHILSSIEKGDPRASEQAASLSDCTRRSNSGLVSESDRAGRGEFCNLYIELLSK